MRPSPPQLALMGQHSGIERERWFLECLDAREPHSFPQWHVRCFDLAKGKNTIVGARTVLACFKAHCKVFIFLSPFCGFRSRSREVTLRMPPHEALSYSPQGVKSKPSRWPSVARCRGVFFCAERTQRASGSLVDRSRAAFGCRLVTSQGEVGARIALAWLRAH